MGELLYHDITVRCMFYSKFNINVYENSVISLSEVLEYENKLYFVIEHKTNINSPPKAK